MVVKIKAQQSLCCHYAKIQGKLIILLNSQSEKHHIHAIQASITTTWNLNHHCTHQPCLDNLDNNEQSKCTSYRVNFPRSSVIIVPHTCIAYWSERFSLPLCTIFSMHPCMHTWCLITNRILSKEMWIAYRRSTIISFMQLVLNVHHDIVVKIHCYIEGVHISLQ